jgi:type VI secretion system protein ImpK
MIASASTPSAPTRALSGASRRLVEAYAPCFTLILKLQATDAFGGEDALREGARVLLDRARRTALDQGHAPDDVAEAHYAVVAFLDETVQGSRWPHRDRWSARPMQLMLYERYDGGEEFFARLERLRADAAAHVDVLEVYYLCLTLGFRGRYQLQGDAPLRVLVENVHAELQRAGRAEAGALSPSGTPGDEAATRRRGRVPNWAVAALAVVLASVVYLGMSLHVSSVAQQARSAMQAPPADVVAGPASAKTPTGVQAVTSQPAALSHGQPGSARQPAAEP